MYDRFVFANAAESHALTEPSGAVVEPDRALQLLSARTGYADWKIVFPGSVMLSPMAAELFGLPETDGSMPLQDMVKLYHAEDRGKLLAMIAQALDGRRGFHYRLRLVTDDNIRMVETIADLRIRDGKVLGLFGLSRDVTQEVDREIAASARMKLVQEMVEDMPCPVVMLDDKLRVLDCSIMWLKAHRFVERREVVGKSIAQLFGTMTPDLISEFDRALKGQLVKTKRSFVSPTTNQAVQFNTVLTPWFLTERKVGGVMVTTGWAEIAVSKGAAPKEPEVDEGFEGSLLELLKTVT
jgi:hypothetical protein